MLLWFIELARDGRETLCCSYRTETFFHIQALSLGILQRLTRQSGSKRFENTRRYVPYFELCLVWTRDVFHIA